MKVRLFAVACLILVSVNVSADEVVLKNAKALFSAETIKSNRMIHPLFGARLSPSGKHLIYPKMVPASPPHYETTFKMMAYEIATGKVEPIEVSLPGGYESVYTRFNFFSPAGDKLVMVETNENGKIKCYDFKKNKLLTVGYGGDLAMFDYTGDSLFAFSSRGGLCMKMKLDGKIIKRIHLPGWVHTPSPFSPYATIFVANPAPDRRTDLELWNLKDEKKLAGLPVHPRNSGLDDKQGSWTADGRYFFYYDTAKKPGETELSGVTRIWDVEKNEQAAELFDLMAVGHGPEKTTMVMIKIDKQAKQDGIFIYDVKTDELLDIGLEDAKAIHACGEKLLYMTKEDGRDMVYIADVSILKCIIDKQ